MAVKCPQCRSENPDGAAHCKNCGLPLAAKIPKPPELSPDHAPTSPPPAAPPQPSASGTAAFETQTLRPQDKDFTPGVLIAGKYKLLEELGRGGMGSVFRAEQVSPIRREVALKIIKLGMDTRRVVARFETERQALAVMDHPGIAHVFDAGATETGRSFFVMECVHGIPIDDYCDRHRLPMRERLDLFIDVCHAVQHAHQKGVVHRDLKPSNILVTVQDERPVPKVIDFGIAKATGHQLAERTLYTEQGQLIGTPEYMSPEQAEMSGLDVDTRTDIYSLGVMLYELLVGELPFDPKTLRSAGFGEIQRIIRDSEPPRPSTRASSLGDRGTAVAERRKTDPALMRKELKGDLDWIIMKAMDKDRTRRYASASELAADIERHLRHEPVSAGPPGMSYRLKKYVRRHKLGVAAASLILLALLAGIAGTSAGLIKATRAEKKAREEAQTAEQVTEFLVNLFKVSDPSEARGNSITAREILEKGAEKIETDLLGQPAIQSRMMETIGQVYQSLGLFSLAEPLLKKSLETRRSALGENHYLTAASMINLAWLYISMRRTGEAETLVQDGIRILETVLPEDNFLLARGLVMLGMIQRDRGELAPARDNLVRALAICEKTLGPDHEFTSYPLYHLGWLHKLTGEYDKAEKYYERAYSVMKKALGPDHPSVLWCLNDMAVVADNKGDFEKSKELYTEALTSGEKIYGPEHPFLAALFNNLGILHLKLGEYQEAESCYRRSLAIREKAFGPEHPYVAGSRNNLGLVYQETGNYALARSCYEKALAIYEKSGGGESLGVIETLVNMAVLDFFSGRYHEARLGFERSLETSERILGPDHEKIAGLLLDYALMLRVAGEYEKAEALYGRALKIKEKVFGPDTVGVAACLIGLGKVCAAKGEVNKADQFYQRSLAIYEKSKNPESADIFYAQASYWAVSGDREKALKYLKLSLEKGYKRAFFNDPDLSSLRGNRGFDALAAESRNRFRIE
jgi:serine/threonine protein kinase/Tfp pilus assembly protein PilF